MYFNTVLIPAVRLPQEINICVASGVSCLVSRAGAREVQDVPPGQEDQQCWGGSRPWTLLGEGRRRQTAAVAMQDSPSFLPRK